NRSGATSLLTKNDNVNVAESGGTAQEQGYGYPVKILKSNGETVTINCPHDHPQTGQRPPPQFTQFGFRPRTIKIVKSNGEVVQQMFLDNESQLPVVSGAGTPCSQTVGMPSGAPLPSVNANGSAIIQIVPTSLSSSVASSGGTPGSTLPMMPPESLQRLVSSAIEQSGSKSLQASKRIMVQYFLKKPEVTTSETGPVVTPTSQASEVAGTKREATKVSTQENSETDTCEGDEFRALFEPEVVLEEANSFLTVKATEASSESDSESSSSEDFVPSPPSSDDSESPTYKRPAAKRGGQRAPAAKRKRAKTATSKSPQKRGVKRKAGKDSGAVPVPKKRRRRPPKKAGRKQKPAQKGARRTASWTPVNCLNCVDTPCSVMLYHLNDSLLRNGRISLKKCNEEELFAFAKSPAVTLYEGKVINIIDRSITSKEVAQPLPQQSSSANNSAPPKLPQKEGKEELVRMLKDRKKDLEELRMRYKC
ncbi:unnamed protein product, partial [Ixodes hexagonus]